MRPCRAKEKAKMDAMAVGKTRRWHRSTGGKGDLRRALLFLGTLGGGGDLEDHKDEYKRQRHMQRTWRKEHRQPGSFPLFSCSSVANVVTSLFY